MKFVALALVALLLASFVTFVLKLVFWTVLTLAHAVAVGVVLGIVFCIIAAVLVGNRR